MQQEYKDQLKQLESELIWAIADHILPKEQFKQFEEKRADITAHGYLQSARGARIIEPLSELIAEEMKGA